jgi:amidase
MDATDLAFAGPGRQAELLRAGEVTARELTELCLGRIRRLDGQLNAFRVVLEEEALIAADQADARLRAGDHRPLLGVPVAIKDDMGVAGQLRTYGTNGVDRPEPADYEIVARLRSAGAVVVGITNVPEMTAWGFTETATNGITRNPWDLQRTPGGSSGGSGAAVAAGLVPVATASDGLGSIRIPAACCGLVGLKGQRGRVPTDPLVDPWHGLSVDGALTRTVADHVLVYGVLAGRSYEAALAGPPGPLRVALSFATPRESRARLDDEARRAVEEVADALRGLGHTVVERDPDLSTAATAASARYLVGIRDDVERHIQHPERLEPRTRGMARLGRLVGARGLAWAKRVEAAHAARAFALFADADVLLTPALAGPPIPVGSSTGHGALRTVDAQSRWAPPYTAVWNHLGNPALALPGGRTRDGLPLGVQLVGPPDAEERLLALAIQLEQARPWAGERPALAA